MNFKIVLKRENNLRIFKKVLLPDQICDNDSVSVIPTYLGICGSDLFHYCNNTEDEICFGHEWIGRVKVVGKNVKHIKVGDTITTSSTLGCGKCSECQKSQVNFCLNPVHLGSPLMGALMGEIILGSFNAKVLKSNSKSEALIEVVAVAEEAIRLMKLETSLEQKKILIIGAGTVGILIAKLLSDEKFNVLIVDPNLSRIERAQKLGLKGMTLRQFKLMGIPHSYDVLFDASSDRGDDSGGFSLWSEYSNIHHHILVIGKYLNSITLDLNAFSKLGGKIKFMRGVPLSTMDFTINKWSSRLEEFAKILISHEFDINDIQRAFDVALVNEISGKVLVKVNTYLLQD